MDQSIIFSVHDFKIYPLTALGDDATDPTYSAALDVPAISEVGLDPEITNAVLRGDGKVVDSRSVLDSLGLSFTYGKLALEVLAAIDGGTVSTNVGTTTSRYVREAADVIPEWGFAALISEVDNPGGAAKLYGYRAKMTGGSIFGASDNDHGEPSFDASVIALPIGAHYAIDLEDVGTALPADGAALIATYAALV